MIRLEVFMIARRRRSKKWISWIIILVLLILAGVVCFLVFENYFKDKEVLGEDEKPETPLDIEEEITEEKKEEEPAKKEEVVKYEGDNPNNLSEITGVITYAGVSGDSLMIRLNIDQFLDGGECMLLLSTAGNVVYSNTVNVVDSATTSSCDGFNIPMSLLESGYYNITVEVESGAKKGKINGEVNL